MICKVSRELRNEQGAVLVRELGIARTFRERAVGLLGRRYLSADQGLYLEQCCCVHMIGMRFPVDVVFLDAHGMIVQMRSMLRPWRIALCWEAGHTLELAAGTIEALRLQEGQYLFPGSGSCTPECC